MEKLCLICSKSFYVKPTRATTAKYCSRVCSGIGTRTGVTKECPVCNISFRVFKCNLKNINYCSYACAGKAMSLHNSPVWKGGRRIDGQGYYLITIGAGKRRYEHRLIMEKIIGRRLLKEEHVHHINGIKTDNRIENLQLLTINEHAKITGKERTKGKWSILHTACLKCNRMDRKHHGNGLCNVCWQATRRKKIEIQQQENHD